MAILPGGNSSMSGVLTSADWNNSNTLSQSGEAEGTGCSVLKEENSFETSYSADSIPSKNWTVKPLLQNVVLLAALVFITTGLTGGAGASNEIGGCKPVLQNWHSIRAGQASKGTGVLNPHGVQYSDTFLSELLEASGMGNLFLMPEIGLKTVIAASQMHNGMIPARALDYPVAHKEAESLNTMQQSVITQAPKYPTSVMAEYKTLSKRKLSNGLTVKESRRLTELKMQINMLDKADPATQLSVENIKQTHKGLTEIRKTLENEISTSPKRT